MEFKKAKIEDAEIIGHIHSKAWKQTYIDIFPKNFLDEDTPEKRRQEFLQSCDSGNIFYYIIYQDKQAIGVVKIIVGIKVCEIASLYILEEYRGKGFGKQVITHVRKEFDKKRIVLWVLESNEKARYFYNSNGFKNTGKTRRINRGNSYVQFQYESL